MNLYSLCLIAGLLVGLSLSASAMGRQKSPQESDDAVFDPKREGSSQSQYETDVMEEKKPSGRSSTLDTSDRAGETFSDFELSESERKALEKHHKSH